MRIAIAAALALLAAQPAAAQLMSDCRGDWHCLRDMQRDRRQARDMDELRERQDQLERERLDDMRRERAPLFRDDLWQPRRHR